MRDEYKVVILDDNKNILNGLKHMLDSSVINFRVYCFDKPDDNFWKLVNKVNIDLFVIDIRLGVNNGRDITDEIIKNKRGSLFLFISGYKYTIESLSRFTGRCTFDFMSKPIDKEIFINRIMVLLSTFKSLIQHTSKDPEDKCYTSFRDHYRTLLENDRLVIENFKEAMDKEFFHLNQDITKIF